MKDRDVLFHEKWLGLAQPIEGLVFSVPVLADAQIAPDIPVELSASFAEHLDTTGARIRNLSTFFGDFLGYDQPGMLAARKDLPNELSFYAAEGGQELRPSFALGRGPFASDDPFATFAEKAPAAPASVADGTYPARWFALLWDLTESGEDIDLDAPESVTGAWRYPPTAKLERLLRHVGIPVGLLFNGRNLRLVYAPAGESTAHLTFRVEHMQRPDGRPILAALDLLLHARRAHTASPEHSLEGLLAESRRRQADVTDELAKQVFEAVEILVSGFEAAAARDCAGTRLDWLRPALEEPGDHFYQGVLSIVLRLVFLFYAEDQGLLPVEHRTYAEHLSLFGLYQRLSHDAGAHPESMHHRFGAYGQLLGLFRAVFFGVKHGTLELPARRGRLFDPNTFPFLEGGQPGWTAAVVDPEARAAALPPSMDDGTIHRVLHRLVVFKGQRLSYRTLDVEQIGSVYESLMGFHVLRLTSPAVRIGKFGVWVESEAVRALSAGDRARFFKETCGLNPGPIQSLEKALKEATDEGTVTEALADQAVGRQAETLRHRASAGRLVLQPGEERRRTASHYTPRSLTEKVVRRTLEPLLACLGEQRASDQILQLKICDPAMGSGAFLVATCRELASEIVTAWTRQGELARIVEEHGDAHLHARRLVAQRCLYGVDKNAAAVELAKLSLWLVTLSRSLPFTFVDHSLRHGDSLVGLNFKQIEAFHWSPPGQVETCRMLLRETLDQAVELRQQILALADHEDAVSQGEKRRLFEFSQQAIERVRLVADVCVGAFFAEAKDATREKERKRRLALVERWLRGDTEAGVQVEALAAIVRKQLAPFHWWIEFPEVFFDERPDPLQGGAINGAALMEAVVGNPPFLGGTRISVANGVAYRDWLADRYDASSLTDLCAFFFRRATELIGRLGTAGLIATNSVAQGDSRKTGLSWICSHGGTIYEAVRSMQWPGDAAVDVSIVHFAQGLSPPPAWLDGLPVPRITSFLSTRGSENPPASLVANRGLAIIGSFVLGIGFVFDDDTPGATTLAELDRLTRADARNSERVFKYIGGEDLNTDPLQQSRRFIIDFGDMTEAEARTWPALFAIVESKVKPARASVQQRDRREEWWRHATRSPVLRAHAAQNGQALARCLVTARVTKHLIFSFQPTDRVFSEQLCIFPLDSSTVFTILQSRVHGPWAWLLSSTMRDAGIRYSATDCFETFPFPSPDPRTVIPELEVIGQTLYDVRAHFMVETEQGLTKTYNAIKDPTCRDARVLELRRLHEAMDRAVLTAYGWTDVVVPPYCPMTDGDRTALQSFEDEVIDRLYFLNAERAREEQRLGTAGRRSKAAASTDASRVKPVKAPRKQKNADAEKATKDQGKLFEP